MDNDNRQTAGRPPFSFLIRFVPIAAIVVLLMFLIPLLRNRHPLEDKPFYIEPPIAMQGSRIRFGRIDTLVNRGLRHFDRGNYEEATRILSKAHFLATVKIKEKEATLYPVDLRFYLGLSHFYRGDAGKGIPFLEEEEKEARSAEKYPWYLAHLYLAANQPDKARAAFERVVELDGAFAGKALQKIDRLSQTGK
jgi:tetratricopeptide (TPR) repeat protein